MGKSFPQSNFGQINVGNINKVTGTLMILLDAKFASKRFSSDAEKKKRKWNVRKLKGDDTFAAAV